VDPEMIDGVIEAGREGLQRDFDESSFLIWKEQAKQCISCILGSNHAYNQYLERYVPKRGPRNILAACGILCAVKETACSGYPKGDRRSRLQ